MQENIISGLISGITVAFLVLVISRFWKSVIVPWFEERVYKDVKIEGKWFSLYPSTVDLRQEIIVLKRHGHAITGKMTCTNSADEGDEYELSGSFRNMLLPLIYETTDKKKTDRGSITLNCIRNGERFSGKIAHYDTLDDCIDTSNVLWFRNKSDLEKTISKIKREKENLSRIREEQERLSKEEKELETVNGEEPVGDNEPIEGELIPDEYTAANKSSQKDADKAGASA